MIEIVIGDKKYVFFNRYENCRDGFNHHSEVFAGHLSARAKCHYINRTWESYTYQSVMRQAVQVLIANEEEHVLWVEGRATGRQRWKKAEKDAALILPDGWESLPEEEKARRLNGVIEVLK